jgi:hypothetical protein
LRSAPSSPSAVALLNACLRFSCPLRPESKTCVALTTADGGNVHIVDFRFPSTPAVQCSLDQAQVRDKSLLHSHKRQRASGASGLRAVSLMQGDAFLVSTTAEELLCWDSLRGARLVAPTHCPEHWSYERETQHVYTIAGCVLSYSCYSVSDDRGRGASRAQALGRQPYALSCVSAARGWLACGDISGAVSLRSTIL